MDIYLVRHTPVSAGRGICYGHLDVALRDGWEAEILRTIRIVPHRSPELTVVSSPLTRCLELAKALSPHVTVDPNLRELSFGDWEGQPWSDIPRQALDHWSQNFAAAGPPNGESFKDLQKRLTHALHAAYQLNKDRLVWVTHGGVIRTFLCMALGLDADKAFDFEVGYGSVTAVRWPASGRARILAVNITPENSPGEP